MAKKRKKRRPSAPPPHHSPRKLPPSRSNPLVKGGKKFFAAFADSIFGKILEALFWGFVKIISKILDHH